MYPALRLPWWAKIIIVLTTPCGCFQDPGREGLGTGTTSGTSGMTSGTSTSTSSGTSSTGWGSSGEDESTGESSSGDSTGGCPPAEPPVCGEVLACEAWAQLVEECDGLAASWVAREKCCEDAAECSDLAGELYLCLSLLPECSQVTQGAYGGPGQPCHEQTVAMERGCAC